MGKNKKKGGKNNNGYFARNVQQNGSNFLTKKTARDIQFDFRNIMRDIAFSDPEMGIPRISEYFTSYTFVQNLAVACSQEYAKENATFIGLQQYLVSNTNIDPMLKLQENMMLSQNKAAAYGLILVSLNNILSLFSVGQIQGVDYDIWLTSNIEMILKSLSAQLKQYKRII